MKSDKTLQQAKDHIDFLIKDQEIESKVVYNKKAVD